jgi:hypothetical protein
MGLQTNKNKLSYLAGIIDGEGNIRIRRSFEKEGWKFQISLSVSNTNPLLVDWLVSNFGGRVYKRQRKMNWKPSLDWEISCVKAYLILKKVYPFLLLKKKQAANCILLQESIKRRKKGKLSSKELFKREKLISEIRTLNMKGVLHA